MHPVIMKSLEEYMAGALPASVQRQFEAHLEMCEECRQEVRGMQEISALFSSLRTDEAVEPRAGFALRVMHQLGARAAPLFWSLFSIDFAFGRRIVFASLMTLAVLGSFLVTRETEYAPGPTNPEVVMAGDEAPSQPAMDRNRMLVALTSYEP